MRRAAAALVLLVLAGCSALRVTEGAIVAGAAYEFADNRGARLSGAADALEARLPTPLTYNGSGDPITWVHHALWTATVGTFLGTVSWLTDRDFRKGFKDGALMGLGFYVIRESVGAFHEERGAWSDTRERPDWQRGIHLGWVWDGLGDVAAPGAIVWLAR